MIWIENNCKLFKAIFVKMLNVLFNNGTVKTIRYIILFDCDM